MKKKVFIGIGVAALVICLVAWGIIKNAGAVGTGAVYSVEASEIKKGDISSYISANGTVTEIEKAEIYIDTPIKATKVYVKQNDSVKKGQKLADFDFDDLNSQLDQAKLTKRTQELTLKKLKLADTTVNVTSAQNALKVAENSVVSAQRSYDNALKNYNDTKKLYEVGDKAKSELDSAENALKETEVALNNAKINLESQKAALKDTSKTNNLSESSKQIDIQTQQVAIDNSTLAIKNLESKIKKISEAMYCTMDGVISQANVSDGSLTPATQPAFVVINPDRLEVKVNINEYNAKQVKQGQKVDITGDSIPETEKITGKVTNVSPVASKSTSGTGSAETVIEVTIGIDNIVESIKPGITVNCDIKIVDITDVLTIQLDMLTQDKDGKNFVFVLSGDKKTMNKKAVELGSTSDMTAEVKGGELKEGDLAVMNPKAAYEDGARVKISEK
ncbi:outer membrane efflux protein [Ruminiclostridium sufflavum DSM 19573]|uniref:Outer membrane efflux protein n=1 Tax=Ruminiclostridium sufflavum DSM 19573 TaxID=1121337 RepID=A0A318XQB5_9FIRM|nr:HlyD family efflux transporter periplasmic adaptor subunit [Ruminiclostridium sufflavum]PYG88425.1 outer membrane efflux protein [Ruminiclostridium sufflavum DSM 19573]